MALLDVDVDDSIHDKKWYQLVSSLSLSLSLSLSFEPFYAAESSASLRGKNKFICKR